MNCTFTKQKIADAQFQKNVWNTKQQCGMKKSAVFSLLLLFASVFFSCGKHTTGAIMSVSDLSDRTVGCQTGTTGESFIQQNVCAKIVPFKTTEDAVQALRKKELDAVIIDEPTALEIVKNTSDLTIIDDSFSEELYAVAVKKGNSALLATINETIAELTESGIFNALTETFILNSGKEKMPEFKKNPTASVLRMGTNASFPPFEYAEGTEVAGFDVILGNYIAEKCGKNLKVIDMAFENLIEALQSDNIDFIAAGMSINEERKKHVDFSEPYYIARQSIIIRKQD